MKMQTEATTKVIEALTHNGYLSTAGLSKSLGISRGQVIDAYNEIEAAGMKLMRVRGPGGGAEFIGKRIRRAA